MTSPSDVYNIRSGYNSRPVEGTRFVSGNDPATSGPPPGPAPGVAAGHPFTVQAVDGRVRIADPWLTQPGAAEYLPPDAARQLALAVWAAADLACLEPGVAA